MRAHSTCNEETRIEAATKRGNCECTLRGVTLPFNGKTQIETAKKNRSNRKRSSRVSMIYL